MNRVEPRTVPSSPPRRGNYGIDAPYAPAFLILYGLFMLAMLIWRLVEPHQGPTRPVHYFTAIVQWVATPWVFLAAGCYLYFTRVGKFKLWSGLLDELDLKGDERVLDIGCGRGAVLLMAAQRLTKGGRAVGVDIWSRKDQSGNAEAVTRRNAELEGVADRVELHTADMRQLPFTDGSFDVVVSSFAIHNVPGAAERAKAIREAARVLRSGGRMMIADVRQTRAYARELQACGLTVTRTSRSVGPLFWFTFGPWGATRVVMASKP